MRPRSEGDGDDVAFAGGRAPDSVVGRVLDVDAVLAVAQVGGTVLIGAYAVAHHLVVRGTEFVDENAADVDAVFVAGDDVARRGGCAPDRVAGCIHDVDAVKGVAELLGARGVGSYVVACNPVARGA